MDALNKLLNKKLDEELDCSDCKHQDCDAAEFPCIRCKNNYANSDPRHETFKLLFEDKYQTSKHDDKKQEKDMVHAPSHYCEGRKYEPRKVIKDWGLDFYLGSALRYIARAGRKFKDKEIEDLRKAIQYIEFRIEELEGKE